MASFKVGDRVTLKQPLPGSNDNMGTVVALNADATIMVQWEGPEAPAKPAKFSALALDRADREGLSEPSVSLGEAVAPKPRRPNSV